MGDDDPTLFDAPTARTRPHDPDMERARRLPPVDEPTGYVGHAHPHTSHAMEANALGRSGTLRRLIVDEIRTAERRDEHGRTDWELEAITGRSHQSVSGARATLKKQGWLEASGVTRPHPDPPHNEWIAWKVTAAGRARLAAEA